MSKPGFKAKCRRAAFTAIGALPPGVTFVIGTQVNSTHGVLKVVILIVGGSCAVISPFTLKWAFRAAEGIEAQAALAAVFDSMGIMTTDPSQAPRLLGKIHDRLTTDLAAKAGRNARCAFYSLEGKGEFLKKQAASDGVNEAPEEFNDKTKPGIDLLHAMKSVEPVYIEDNQYANGNMSVNLGNGYRSAIVVPVYAGNEAQGLFIIDAPKAKMLSRGKVRDSLVRVFARLLGTAHALGSPTVNPTSLPPQRDGDHSGDDASARG